MSELGTFLSEDSLLGSPEDPPGRHLYAYAQGDPIDGWDPDGRLCRFGAEDCYWLSHPQLSEQQEIEWLARKRALARRQEAARREFERYQYRGAYVNYQLLHRKVTSPSIGIDAPPPWSIEVHGVFAIDIDTAWRPAGPVAVKSFKGGVVVAIAGGDLGIGLDGSVRSIGFGALTVKTGGASRSIAAGNAWPASIAGRETVASWGGGLVLNPGLAYEVTRTIETTHKVNGHGPLPPLRLKLKSELKGSIGYQPWAYVAAAVAPAAGLMTDARAILTGVVARIGRGVIDAGLKPGQIRWQPGG